MKKHYCSLLLLLAILVNAPVANAAFIIKKKAPHAVQLADSTKIFSESPGAPTDVSSPSTVLDQFMAFSKKKEKSGILAYISIGCAALGFAVGSIHTTFIMLILGTIAFISGKMGVKAYKGRNGLRALSIIGLILGAILVVYATIPLLFLV